MARTKSEVEKLAVYPVRFYRLAEMCNLLSSQVLGSANTIRTIPNVNLISSSED